MKIKGLLAALLAIGVLASTVYANNAADTEAVLNNHLSSFGSGDVDGILSDYTDHSAIILPGAVLHGKEEIRGLFNALVAEFSQEGVEFNLIESRVENNIAYIVWNARTPDNIYRFASDTFVVEDGKIVLQTVAFDVEKP